MKDNKTLFKLIILFYSGTCQKMPLQTFSRYYYLREGRIFSTSEWGLGIT